MYKKQYLSQADESEMIQDPGALPTDRPVAVYYRQSTGEQVGNVSTLLQTVDMAAYLQQRGWKPEDIIMVDMDEGVSGTTKIDERPGMSMLFGLITEGKVGAIACQDEDRLFRDVTQIQVNIFIEACRSANVKVLTPSMVYDFTNEMTGSFHARQFRFKSEMAAEYINAVIRGKLHRARRRIQLEGRWSGHNVPPGYMFDTRKTLSDGSKNDNWRRYVPFEPYAEVVREYFRLFLSHSGNLSATLRHIHLHGPYYPDPATCRPPEGFEAIYQMKRYPNGYCPGDAALSRLLTQAVYIGHWAVKNLIVRWNNHPPIVDGDIFTRAYNYLMPFTLDGQPNSAYKPFRIQARPTLDENRPVARPLCAGMMYSRYKGEWCKVGTRWQQAKKHYQYWLRGVDIVEICVWSKSANMVDDAVSALLLEKLQVTFQNSEWQKAIDVFNEEVDSERNIKQSQLHALERVIENLVLSLETITNAEMIQSVQQRFEAAKIEQVRLSNEISAMEQVAKRTEVLRYLRENYTEVLEYWHTYSHEEKRSVFHAFIRRIEAENLGHGALRIAVYWLDNSSDTIDIRKNSPTGENWLPTEVTKLLQMLDVQATQVQLCQAFPERNWHSIDSKIREQRGKVAYLIGAKFIRSYERYEDHLLRLREKPKARPSERWTPEEERLLLELLEKHADELELASAFPRRTWFSIRKKAAALTGKRMHIKRAKNIREDETITMYRERIGSPELPNEIDDLCITSDDHSLMASPTSETPTRPYKPRWQISRSCP